MVQTISMRIYTPSLGEEIVIAMHAHASDQCPVDPQLLWKLGPSDMGG